LEFQQHIAGHALDRFAGLRGDDGQDGAGPGLELFDLLGGRDGIGIPAGELLGMEAFQQPFRVLRRFGGVPRDILDVGADEALLGRFELGAEVRQPDGRVFDGGRGAADIPGNGPAAEAAVGQGNDFAELFVVEDGVTGHV
jgi:hypothetical protein